MVTHRFILRGMLSAATAISLGASALSAQQKCPAVEPGVNMPLKYKGGATVAAITACDLMTRLYIYADDSMRGREAGSPDYAIRATKYIESQVRAMGLKPGGDNGTFFQYMPVVSRVGDSATATIMAGGGSTFQAYKDFTTVNTNAAIDRRQ